MTATPVHAPTQARSREMQDRLVGAFERLLATEPYDAITVAAVVREAGASVGAFYARFRGKDALLLPLAARIIREAEESLLDSLDDRRVGRAGLATIVERYTGVMIDQFRRHRLAWHAITRHARGASGAAIARETQRFNRVVHGRFETLALARRDEIGHPDPEFAIEFSLFQASAVARNAALTDNLRAYSLRPTPERLIAEIARGWSAYLILAARPTRSSRRSQS